MTASTTREGTKKRSRKKTKEKKDRSRLGGGKESQTKTKGKGMEKKPIIEGHQNHVIWEKPADQYYGKRKMGGPEFK